MKKIISMVFIAGMIVNGISAMEEPKLSEASVQTDMPNTPADVPSTPEIRTETLSDKTEILDSSVSSVSESSVESASADAKDSSGAKETNNAAATGINKWIAPVRKFVLDHKIASSIVGLAVAGYVGHKVMVSVCPWYKQLVGDEDEEETKMPRLNPRVMNPARPF